MLRLEDIGLSASKMIAGFSGGLLYSFAIKEKDPRSIVVSVMAGALTANFLSDATAHYVPAWVGAGGVSFLTGLTAMAICQGVIAWVRSKLKIVGDDADRGKRL